MTPKTHEILPGKLWIRGRTNHLHYDDRRQLERALGLRLVVSVCPNPDYGWDPFVPSVHWPMADGDKIPEGIETLAADLAWGIQNNESRVLIYCNAGRNRSALLAALVVKRINNLTGAEALEFVRKRRPNALANPAFAAYLERQG